MQTQVTPKFALGQMLITPGVLDAIDAHNNGDDNFRTEIICDLLGRHMTGDWGTVCAEDKACNDLALVHGDRVLSAYNLPDNGVKVWVITEADRSSTTILLPEEY